MTVENTAIFQGMVLNAEQQANEGAFDEALETLRKLPRDTSYSFLDTEGFSAFQRTILKIVYRGQVLFGSGERAEAVRILLGLTEVAPDDRNAVIELLTISLYLMPDQALADRMAQHAEKHGIADDRLWVLLCEFYSRKGDFLKAIDYYSRIAKVEFFNPSYAAWKHVACGGTVSALFKSLIQLRSVTDLQFLEGAYSALVASIAATFQDPNSFAVKVAFFSFYNEYGIGHAYSITADALFRIAPYVDTERRAIIAAYLIATNDRSRIEAFLQRFQDDAALWAHPTFARVVCNHARGLGDRALEDKALSRVLAGGMDPSWVLANREVQLLELHGRAATLERLADAPAAAPEAGKPPVVFVGVFGQLRHERDVLPALAEYLRREEAVLHEAFGVRLQVGFSVWDSTGQRPILDAGGNHGGIDVLYARLPAGLVHILKTHGLHSLEAFAAAFPRTFDYAVACGREVSQVDPGLIEGLFPGAAAVDIAVKADFAAEEEALMAASSRPGPRPADWRNQLRMWHRVGAFAPMIAALEEREGAPIAAGALVRADLLLGNGSLAELLRPVLEGRRSRSVCADYDPCAIYFEGVGDRYFAGDRDGILTVASCWEVMKERIAACGDEGAARERARRFGSHVFVGARLFEEAIQVIHVPRAQMEFEVCRGFLKVADFRAMMLEDCGALANPALRQQVLDFLNAG